MGRDLQKKKRRSKRQPVQQHTARQKVLNPRGNSIIAKNWDKKETLSQNYRRLGLVSRLRGATGGVETLVSDAIQENRKPVSSLAISTSEAPVVGEIKVERDAEGRITRVLGPKRRDNPLNDLLNDIEDAEMDAEDGDDGEEWGGIADEGGPRPRTRIVRELEEMASRPEVKRPRHVSEREREWLEGLVGRHGDDCQAMARDRKLNPMQQTAADIARRIRKLGVGAAE